MPKKYAKKDMQKQICKKRYAKERETSILFEGTAMQL